MNLLLRTLFCVLILYKGHFVQSNCSTNLWVEHDGNCYLVIRQPEQVNAAKRVCEALPTQPKPKLAFPKSALDTTFFLNLKVPGTRDKIFDQSNRILIGVKFVRNWVDLSTENAGNVLITWSNWGQTADPSGSAGECAVMDGSNRGEWINIQCADLPNQPAPSHPYVCSYSLPQTTITTTTTTTATTTTAMTTPDPCKPNPCGEGSCLAKGTEIECDYCSPNQCEAGDCLSVESEMFENKTYNFTCVCPDRYEGPFCTLKDNPCVDNPEAKCKYGGECKVKEQPGKNDWFCVCPGRPVKGQKKDCSTGKSDETIRYEYKQKVIIIAAVTIPGSIIGIAWVVCCVFECYEIGELPDLEDLEVASESESSVNETSTFIESENFRSVRSKRSGSVRSMKSAHKATKPIGKGVTNGRLTKTGEKKRTSKRSIKSNAKSRRSNASSRRCNSLNKPTTSENKRKPPKGTARSMWKVGSNTAIALVRFRTPLRTQKKIKDNKAMLSANKKTTEREEHFDKKSTNSSMKTALWW